MLTISSVLAHNKLDNKMFVRYNVVNVLHDIIGLGKIQC
jgi:hypothetical protein